MDGYSLKQSVELMTSYPNISVSRGLFDTSDSDRTVEVVCLSARLSTGGSMVAGRQEERPTRVWTTSRGLEISSRLSLVLSKFRPSIHVGPRGGRAAERPESRPSALAKQQLWVG